MIAKLLLTLAAWLLAAGMALAQVNINSATRDQLDGLKGIGPTKAQAIIDYRRQHGPYRNVDDLLSVPGIGPETLKGMRHMTSRSVAPAAHRRRPAAHQPRASQAGKPAAAPARQQRKRQTRATRHADQGTGRQTSRMPLPPRPRLASQAARPSRPARQSRPMRLHQQRL